MVYKKPFEQAFIHARDYAKLRRLTFKLANFVKMLDLKGAVKALRDVIDPDSLKGPLRSQLPGCNDEKLVRLIRALLTFQNEAMAQTEVANEEIPDPTWIEMSDERNAGTKTEGERWSERT